MTFLQAKAVADQRALETGQVYSVRSYRTVVPLRYYVRKGMVGTIDGHAHYTARPDTLRWSKETRSGFGQKLVVEKVGV
jgi:hypothetical protein